MQVKIVHVKEFVDVHDKIFSCICTTTIQLQMRLIFILCMCLHRIIYKLLQVALETRNINLEILHGTVPAKPHFAIASVWNELIYFNISHFCIPTLSPPSARDSTGMKITSNSSDSINLHLW